MGYLNRWSMSCLWVAAMILAWFNVDPSLLSPSTWLIGALAGPVLIVGTATFWDTARPTPSFGQSQATGDAAKVATGQRRLLLARLQKECDRARPKRFPLPLKSWSTRSASTRMFRAST